MERKTKHRILGILVVVGLVIILLPFFQSSNENSSEATVIKAPPFPDQAAQMPTPEPLQSPAPQDRDMSAPQPLPLQNPDQDSGMNTQPDDTVNPNTPAQSSPPLPNQENATTAPITSQTDMGNNMETTTISLDAPDQLTDQAETKPQLKPQTEPVQVRMVSAKPETKKINTKLARASKKRLNPLKQPIDDNGLFNLKSSAWVIQMGSFKNKTNAIRLVNKLRANGYAAFIQQVASNTRVYVGPQNKQASARMIASQLKDEMKLQGIVISYKPLAI